MKMKKWILTGIFSLCLLTAPLGAVEVHAAGDAQATTEFVYRPSKKTQIDRGSAAAKTGDSAELGKWLMLGSGSGMLLLLLLLGLKRRSEEESGEACPLPPGEIWERAKSPPEEMASKPEGLEDRYKKTKTIKRRENL